MSPSGHALVVKLSSLGDLFHALPAVHALKAAFQWEIDWVTQPEYVELVRCFDDVDGVIAFPRRHAVRSLPQWLGTLRARRYDVILDFQGLLKSALVTRLACGERRVGPSWQREGARFLYSEIAGRRNKQRHAVDEACEVAVDLGAPVDEIVFPVTFPRAPLATTSPRIAYVPCSRWPTKNIDPVFLTDVIRGIHQVCGGTPYLLGGAGDRPVLASMAGTLADLQPVNLGGTTTLVELGGVLQEMDLIVTVDSGPMHMAAALGIPVVALFGPTDPLRTGPYGPQHRVLQQTELTCVPCHSRQCQRRERDHACLRRWTVEEVVTACLQGRSQTSSPRSGRLSSE